MEELKIGGRSNGKSLENAITFMKYIDELENNKLYGIKKSGNITLLTKTECIPISFIEKIIKEKIEWCIKVLNSGLNAIQYACSKEDEIERIERQKNISTMISILKEMLQELLDERNNTDE